MEEIRNVDDRLKQAIRDAEAGTISLTEAVVAAATLTRRARRRLSIALTIFFLLSVCTAIQLHDEHVRHCMVYGQPDSQQEKKICDRIFPLHDHHIGGPR